MDKLRIALVPDDKPVRLAVELPATVFQDLTLYAATIAQSAGKAGKPEPARLIPLMVARFMESDRAFRKRRRQAAPSALPEAKSG
ncbi:DUF2274 domain-containing protein [Nguyenibacter vanlangensis]|uniref:DUF2274 domain-containing protein n=1 Tax=Nguyenibacter vanlangensis TaxID=1216886 RepID=A0ABZ3D0B6_9PROT